MSVRRISGKEHNAFGELGLFDIKVEGESDGVAEGKVEGKSDGAVDGKVEGKSDDLEDGDSEGGFDFMRVGEAEGILVFKLVVAFQCTASKPTYPVDRHGSWL